MARLLRLSYLSEESVRWILNILHTAAETQTEYFLCTTNSLLGVLDQFLFFFFQTTTFTHSASLLKQEKKEIDPGRQAKNLWCTWSIQSTSQQQCAICLEFIAHTLQTNNWDAKVWQSFSRRAGVKVWKDKNNSHNVKLKKMSGAPAFRAKVIRTELVLMMLRGGKRK